MSSSVLVLITTAVAACSSSDDSSSEPPITLPESRTQGCDSASAPKCGSHGRCEGSPAACTCLPGYGGATCEVCATGFQDNDGDGICTASCATADLKCGAHQACSDVAGLATCTCVTAYSLEAGNACVFKGGPLDPGFAAAPSPWTTSGNASIASGAPTTTVTGAIDVGLARFHGAGTITQSFEMPAYTDAEPLAIEVNNGCKTQCANVATDALAIALGDRALDLPLTQNTLASRKVCLGDRAFGRKVTLTASAFASTSAADKADDDAFLDRIAFVPAPDCPAPGVVANGDFEASGGWSTGGQGLAEVATGVGTNGSRAGRLLAAANVCETPSLASVISVPEKLDRPALIFSIKGTRDRDASIALDNRSVATVRGSGAFEQAVVCLPEWSRGFAHTLKVQAGERYTSCMLPSSNEVIIDDFKVASHPSCGAAAASTPAYVLDGDFERKLANAWPEGVGDGVSVAVIHDDVASAHTGNSILQLNTFTCSRAVIADQWVASPARPAAGAAAAGGPVLKFWYKTINASATSFVIAAGKTLTPSPDGWKEERVCLPPSSWGRATYTGFAVTSPTGGQCAVSMQLDDVTVAIDPMCPAD